MSRLFGGWSKKSLQLVHETNFQYVNLALTIAFFILSNKSYKVGFYSQQDTYDSWYISYL